MSILLMKQRLHSSFPSSLTRKPSNGRKHTWHLFGMTTKGSNTLHSKNFLCLLQTHQPNTTANNWLISLRQGKRTIEEYLAEFRLFTSLVGMILDTPSDNIHLINYFQRGLNPAIAKKITLSDNMPTTIAKKITLSDNMPTTIAEWSDRAVQYNTNYRLTMAMLGRTAYRKSDNVNWRAISSNQRDPNVMDIDTMTAESEPP